LVICPKCGNKLQYRKIIFLTNLNAITCQVCSSKLRVKNKEISSIIGGVGGGLGGGLGGWLLISWFLSRNILFLVLTATLFALLLVIPFVLFDKYVKLELETGPRRTELSV
jgi:hypothetical protein